MIGYDKQEPNSNIVGLAILATVLFLIVVFIASYYIFVSLLSADSVYKRSLSSTTQLQTHLTKQRQNLMSIYWEDKANKRVKVPITIGFERVVKDYN